LLTPVRISARLANIDYVDTGSDRHRQRPGFFTEHFARVASRTSRQYYEPELLHMNEVDAQAMARHALFQYMIGNLDWSAVKSHNVALFRAADGRVSPAPFDFDYSGLVAAEYAAPPKGLKVSQVSTRLFRGYCVPGTDWDAIFEEFMSIRGALLEEINGLPWTLSAEKRRVRLYLKYFYDKIESRRGRQAIIDSCRPVPESLQ
jgi:hypothetical protein